jgi:hypothetical protein
MAVRVATNQTRKAKAAPKKQPEVVFLDQPMKAIGGFGCRPVRTPETMYVKMGKMGNGGGTGSVTTKRELGLVLTDFFDYTNDFAAAGANQFVNNYIWNVAQNLFDTTGGVPVAGTDSTFCRIRKVEVWVLPQCRTFGAGEGAPTNANAMYTVNCQVPGTSTQFINSTAGAQAFATNTQVTNVLPMIDTKWKKVLTADLQKTFQSGVIRPVFSDTNNTDQCVFSMSVSDPTTGRPYQNGDDVPPIRVKVKLTLDQPIGTINAAQLTVFRNEEFSLPFEAQNGPDYAGTSLQYVQLDLRSVRDNMS